MSSFMRAADYRLTMLVRTSTKSLCGSTGHCPTTSTSRVSSSILDGAIIKDVAKVSGSSPNRVPRWLPGHWLPPAADACH